MAGCRFCGDPLRRVFADLGLTPLANALITPERTGEPDAAYPLRAMVCEACLLVQVEDVASREQIFTPGYTYYSSYSSSWLAHCRRYAHDVIGRFGLRAGSSVVEVASNDGYLLQYFLGRGMRILGVEPATLVGRTAALRGIPTVAEFFGVRLASELSREGRADLVIANNVLPHVPDPNDFVAGLREILAPGGVLSIEFQHLQRLVEEGHFDTIYHEHFSYFSLLVAERLLAAHGLALFDAEELPTHGGSLRVFAQHADTGEHARAAGVDAILSREREAGYDDPAFYDGFQAKLEVVRREIVDFFASAREQERMVAGYGAPAKGTTLLNFCGIGPDDLCFTVDRNPAKQGTWLPGRRIPVLAPEALAEARPDYIMILPWNLRDEIVEQLASTREWGAQFVVRTPAFTVVP